VIRWHEYKIILTFYSHMCHTSIKVLEVLVTDEATKTFSFVAFLFELILKL